MASFIEIILVERLDRFLNIRGIFPVNRRLVSELEIGINILYLFSNDVEEGPRFTNKPAIFIIIGVVDTSTS